MPPATLRHAAMMMLITIFAVHYSACCRQFDAAGDYAFRPPLLSLRLIAAIADYAIARFYSLSPLFSLLAAAFAITLAAATCCRFRGLRFRFHILLLIAAFHATCRHITPHFAAPPLSAAIIFAMRYAVTPPALSIIDTDRYLLIRHARRFRCQRRFPDAISAAGFRFAVSILPPPRHAITLPLSPVFSPLSYDILLFAADIDTP